MHGHALLYTTGTVFWSVNLDIFTISMSHDLRVGLLAAITTFH